MTTLKKGEEELQGLNEETTSFQSSKEIQSQSLDSLDQNVQQDKIQEKEPQTENREEHDKAKLASNKFEAEEKELKKPSKQALIERSESEESDRKRQKLIDKNGNEETMTNAFDSPKKISQKQKEKPKRKKGKKRAMSSSESEEESKTKSGDPFTFSMNSKQMKALIQAVNFLQEKNGHSKKEKSKKKKENRRRSEGQDRMRSKDKRKEKKVSHSESESDQEMSSSNESESESEENSNSESDSESNSENETSSDSESMSESESESELENEKIKIKETKSDRSKGQAKINSKAGEEMRHRSPVTKENDPKYPIQENRAEKKKERDRDRAKKLLDPKQKKPSNSPQGDSSNLSTQMISQKYPRLQKLSQLEEENQNLNSLIPSNKSAFTNVVTPQPIRLKQEKTHLRSLFNGPIKLGPNYSQPQPQSQPLSKHSKQISLNSSKSTPIVNNVNFKSNPSHPTHLSSSMGKSSTNTTNVIMNPNNPSFLNPSFLNSSNSNSILNPPKTQASWIQSQSQSQPQPQLQSQSQSQPQTQPQPLLSNTSQYTSTIQNQNPNQKSFMGGKFSAFSVPEQPKSSRQKNTYLFHKSSFHVRTAYLIFSSQIQKNFQSNQKFQNVNR